MQLTMMNGGIASATISRYVELADPKLVARMLIEDRNVSPALALSISLGALLRRKTTIALAQSYRLID